MILRLEIAVLCLMSFIGFSKRLSADVIVDTFDDQIVTSGIGTPLDYFSFGEQLSDRGVSASLGSTSGANAAFYVIDFDQSGFGVGAAHQNLALSVTSQQLLQVNVRIANGQANSSFIGFRLTDLDGTIMRTADADLFSASSNFQTLSQTISGLTAVDASGSVAGLNLTQINSVGLLFFDQGFGGTATVVFDDLKIVAVPEPSSLVTVGAVIICVAALRWRFVRS